MWTRQNNLQIFGIGCLQQCDGQTDVGLQYETAALVGGGGVIVQFLSVKYIEKTCGRSSVKRRWDRSGVLFAHRTHNVEVVEQFLARSAGLYLGGEKAVFVLSTRSVFFRLIL